MHLRNYLLTGALIVVLLFSVGCQATEKPTDEKEFSQSTDIIAENDNGKKYYTLKDFEGIVIGESTSRDLEKYVGFPTDPPRCTSLASGDVVITYPAKDNQCIYVLIRVSDSVIIHIEQAPKY